MQQRSHKRRAQAKRLLGLRTPNLVSAAEIYRSAPSPIIICLLLFVPPWGLDFPVRVLRVYDGRSDLRQARGFPRARVGGREGHSRPLAGFPKSCSTGSCRYGTARTGTSGSRTCARRRPSRHNSRGTWRGSAAVQPGAVRLVANGVCLAEPLVFSTKRIGTQIHLAQRSGQRELARIRSLACAAPRPQRRVPRGCRGRRAP